jgi:hypothetical protein
MNATFSGRAEPCMKSSTFKSTPHCNLKLQHAQSALHHKGLQTATGTKLITVPSIELN